MAAAPLIAPAHPGSYGARHLLAVFLLLGVSLAACGSLPGQTSDGTRPHTGDSGTRVLFIGNSYTFYNNLPGVFTTLAAAAGYEVTAEMAAPGGARLEDHANSPDIARPIRTGLWSHVVLQEQSQIPSVEQARQSQMFPAARRLAQEIRSSRAAVVFFPTWGRKEGWPENGMPDYVSMQAQISLGYRQIAREVKAIVAPVDIAWAGIARQHPEITLWQADGSHPTLQGTFLAAAVLVRTLCRTMPDARRLAVPLPPSQVSLLLQAAEKAASLPVP